MTRLESAAGARSELFRFGCRSSTSARSHMLDPVHISGSYAMPSGRREVVGGSSAGAR